MVTFFVIAYWNRYHVVVIVVTLSTIASLLGIKESFKTLYVSFNPDAFFIAPLDSQSNCFIFSLPGVSKLFLLLLFPEISEDHRGDISGPFSGSILKLLPISSHLFSDGVMIVGRVEKPSIHSRFLHRAVHVHSCGLIDSLRSESTSIGGRILDEKLFKLGADGWLVLLRLLQWYLSVVMFCLSCRGGLTTFDRDIAFHLWYLL